MKKVLSLILCVLMLVSVCGCSASEDKQTTGTTEPVANALKVGFSRKDITPTETGLPMTSSRYTSGVVDNLYGTCIAITDAYDNTILLFHLDLQSSYDAICQWARKDIVKELGIPAECIMFTATHTHRSPACGRDDEGITRYNKMVRGLLVEAAKLAMADRKPAEMYTSSFELTGFNFVKKSHNYSFSV